MYGRVPGKRRMAISHDGVEEGLLKKYLRDCIEETERRCGNKKYYST